MENLYHERYRPQFHFTARQGWLNDPNGLVFYKGEYHLFFQHNPEGTDWGNMTWGHALSRDLVHWQQLPHALYPDDLGTMFSGSAAVDWKNTAGLQTGDEKVIVAAYTAAGEFVSPPKPFTQCLAYSDDCGRTWRKYARNPVLPNLSGHADRDPKIFWHESSGKWVMALYLDQPRSFDLFTSPDLKTWTHTCSIPELYECPDLFELPVDGDSSDTKWVLLEADGRYMLGDFDGQVFRPETPKQSLDHGKNFYATQTYNDIPAQDGRRIQIAWMKGGHYPGMPFNQQMSFPCALTLRTTREGMRVFRNPVREIASIRGDEVTLADMRLEPGAHRLADLPGRLVDLTLDIDLGDATEVSLHALGQDIRYSVKDGLLSCLGGVAPMALESKKLSLRALIDRVSIELFGNDGSVSLSSCFLPDETDLALTLNVSSGPAHLCSAHIFPLQGIWS